jgi:3-dehydroquinate dehydratase II
LRQTSGQYQNKGPDTLTRKILVLHGPNLNLLGIREPQHYGRDTLDAINQRLKKTAAAAGFELEAVQSNAEHVLIDRIHAALGDQTEFIIINPAAFTHTSVALRDALAGVKLPFIEVHLSNVHAREPFRQHSYFSDLAVGVICGLGAQGYELALTHALARLSDQL